MKPVDITDSTWDAFITKNQLVIIDFWASWCGPCRSFSPVFEQASANHPDIAFGKVNTQIHPRLAKAKQINSIPTLMAFKNGILVHSEPGALDPVALEQLLTALEGHDTNTRSN